MTSVYCPVGKPISGVTAHILDQDKQPVPIGKPGEVCCYFIPIQLKSITIEYILLINIAKQILLFFL